MADEPEPKPLGKLYCNMEDRKVEVFVLRACFLWHDELECWVDGVVFYHANDTSEPLKWYVDSLDNFNAEFELVS